MTLKRGGLIGTRYELTRPIAVGGMGAVWAATDRLLEREVAIKVLKPEFSSDPAFLDRFRAEARHGAGLSHPNVAGIYDYGETLDADHRVAFLVMELVPGEPLTTSMAAGRLPTDTVLDVLSQVGSGLAAAHAKGLVHRDIKPGNLLLTPDGTVKITDFGIARTVDAVPLTATGTVMGTARYLSPEQAMGLAVTAASDVYSLGVVGYEMLCGRPPFEASTPVAQAMAHVHDQPRPLPDGVPAPVAELIETMMAKEPGQRPADGAALARRVAAVRTGATAAEPQPTRVLPVLGGQTGDGQTAVLTPPPGPTTAAPTAAVAPAVAAGPAARPARGRRAISGPLLALILLVLFVAVGTAFAGDSLRGLFDRGPAPTTNTVTVTQTSTHSSSSSSSSSDQPSTSASPTSVSSSEPAPTSVAPTSEPSVNPGNGGATDETNKPDKPDKTDKTDKTSDAVSTSSPPSSPSAIEGSN